MALTIVKAPEVQVKTELLDEFSMKTFVYLKKYLSYFEAKAIWMAGQKIADLRERHLFYTQVILDCEKNLHGENLNIVGLDVYGTYKWQPVGVEEFCTSEYYLNKKDELYPAVLEALVEVNSGKYVEAVFTGGIGSAKTTTALYTNAYQLYLLSCMRSPHRTYGLDPSSEILLIFQSINAKLARSVDFARFKSMIEGSQYFREKFWFDKNVTSKLVFPGRIEVVPVSGAETAAIGQNVIGGLIDELNYMAVVEKSKQSVDAGTYDQAIALYNSIARRRKSRFMENGVMPGILCLVSSKKYPGQFTDQKEEEAKSDPTIYIYDKKVWEIKPAGTYTEGWFDVFVGDMTRKPRLLESNEEVKDDDRHLILKVPMEYRAEFVKDIINALREIGGVSTLARHPYFMETDRVAASFGRHHSIFKEQVVDFVSQPLSIQKAAFWRPELPRFAHVDLAISGDSAGLAIGCVTDFVSMSSLGRGQEEGLMPKIRFDGLLEIRPPKGGEILFWKVREVILTLRKLGLNIRWVTYDSFESTDSMQLLRQQGFVTGIQSMDVIPCKPYDFLKSAVYDGRVTAPVHPHTQKELLMLERDQKTMKIDHPPAGSKDCADAMAGVCFGLTMRREIWGSFGIPLVLVPSSIGMAESDKLEDKNEKLVGAMKQAEEMSEMQRIRSRV